MFSYWLQYSSKCCVLCAFFAEHLLCCGEYCKIKLMDCITFNKDIDEFIRGELCDEELNAFLLHLKGCKSCEEELQVNYIVQEGMRRMNDRHASLNIASAYTHELVTDREYIVSRKRMIVVSDIFRTLVFWTVLAVAIVFVRVAFFPT